MADAYIGNRAKRLDISPEFSGYSRVIIYTGEEDSNGNKIYFSAGNTVGRTLEITNPWANQAMANNVLTKINGWVYQPYEAEGARLNPAAEMGDSVTISDIYSGIYSRELNFTGLYKPNLSAPYDEEIDHEYTYETQAERRYERKFNDLSTSLTINAGQIAANASAISNQGTQISNLSVRADNISASVSAETTRATNAENGKLNHTNTNSSFGWSLTSTAFSLKNNNTDVFKFDANGLRFISNGADVFTVTRTGGLYVKGNGEFTGKVTAQSGQIGGFTIGSNAIYNNISSFGGSQSTGVYVGTNGIQCGSGFRVDASGNIIASSGTFSGNVYAKNIQYGGSYGTLSGAGISGSSIGTGHLVSGINTSLGYANFANDVFNKRDKANYIYANWVVATKSMSAPTYYVDDGTEENPGGGTINKHTHYVTVSGNQVTIGAPDFTGAKHPFSVAPSIEGATISLNGGAIYQASLRRYAVPVRATNGNGEVIATGTIYVGGSAAYNAGADSVDVEWSEGDWDIWIDPYYYDAWEEINGGLAHTRLTNGKERTVRLSW